MKSLRNKIHIKPVKSDDTETMIERQNESRFTGFVTHGKLYWFAFKNQTVAFENPIYLSF